MELLNKLHLFSKSDKPFFHLYKNQNKLEASIFLLLMNFFSETVVANSMDFDFEYQAEVLDTEDEGIGYNYTQLDNSFEEAEGSYQMMPIYGYILSAIFLFLIWIIGTAGNFMVPYLVLTNRQLQTPMNLFLVNLSIADFTMTAFGSPISFSAAVLGGWPFGKTGCVIYGFGMALGGITSITTLMVLAFERFLMIARPFRAGDLQNQHSVVFIIAIWIYSLVLTTPPLIGWASYGPEAAYISCSVSWEKDDVGTTSYIIFLFTMGLVLPLITIIFSYLGILITIRQTGASQSTTSATGRAELRVIGMVAVMVSSFMIAWSPYAVLSLIVAFSPNARKDITPFLAVLPSMFAKSSSCYNPFIYVGLNTQFRTAWLKLLGLERPRDDEGGTGMTMSATAAVPKDMHYHANYDDEECENDRKVESSFISKNHRDSKSDKENLPLLQDNVHTEIEKFPATQNPIQHHYQRSDIPTSKSEMDQISTGLIDQIKSSSTEILTEQIPLADEETSISDRPKNLGINGDGGCRKKNSSNVKFVDGR